MKYKSDPIKTVLVITTGFLFIYLITKWELMLFIALTIGFVGIMSTSLAKGIDFLWMKISWVLSKIVPNILLSIVYYLFLTPLALLSKVFGEKNQLTLKNTEKSMFKDYNKVFNTESFEKLW